MKLYKLFLLLFFLSGTASAQYTEVINSNRPGNSQSAFSVGTGVLQFEAGGKYGEDAHELLKTETELWGVEYAVRYGFLFEELEISLMGSYLNSTTTYLTRVQRDPRELSGFDSNTLGLKYLIYDPYKNGVGREISLYSWKANQRFDWSVLIPAVAVYAGANIAMDENPYLYEGQGKFSPRVALISQNNWGPWVLVLNIIGDKLGETYPSYSAIVTMTHSFNAKFAAFGEFQGIMSDLYSDEILRGGFAYLFHPNFQADISGLVNFKDTPSRWQAAVGLSYRFDWHKQDKFLPEAE